MGSLLALALLSAAPTTAVLLARKVSVPAADAAALATQAQTLLGEAGVTTKPAAETSRRLAKLALKDATTCSGKPACLAELGHQLEADWLILVSVSRIAGQRSVALELFDVSAQAVVDRDSLLLPAGAPLTQELFDAFTARVKSRLAPPPPPEPPMVKPPDAPVAARLTPPAPPEVVLPPAAPVERSHAASWALGGAGVAAVGAGIALLVAGLATQARVNGAPDSTGRLRSQLTGSQAQLAARTATTELGLAGALGAVGLGLGTTAVVIW